MVKVKSKHGDIKKGRQGPGVYQARYGQGVRRKFTEKRVARTQAQADVRARFHAGIRFAQELNSVEIATIKERIKELGLKTSWYNFAKKAVMQRAEFEISAAEGETIEWEIRVGHQMLETLEVYDEGDTLVYKLDRITDLEAGYICSVHKVALEGYLKKIVVKSYADKIYESIDLNLIGGKYMRKDVYDQNDNGIVDDSEKLEGKTYAQVEGAMDTKITDHAAAEAAHHSRYADSEARTAIGDLLDSAGKVLENMNFDKKQGLAFVIENRTSDPDTPADGQIWLRTDL